MENYLSRITVNPDILHGKPAIRNMRYSVEMILDLLSSGMTSEEIINDYPALEIEDIQACLQFASRLTRIHTCCSCMKLIIDAQLPFKLAGLLQDKGHDVIHTDDLLLRKRPLTMKSDIFHK